MSDCIMQKARAYLIKRDPILAKVIHNTLPWEQHCRNNYFLDLVESIIAQQLSLKAADTLWKRFQALFPSKKITPFHVLAMDDGKIRACGLSGSKITYIKDLAKHIQEGSIAFEHFTTMSDEEIIKTLTRVKGIGQWTAEMFLMFSMGRPDVFSYGDLGIRKAIQKLYGFKEVPSRKQAEEIAQKWRPYRSYACYYLWRSLA